MPSYYVTISDDDKKEPIVEEDVTEAQPNSKKENKFLLNLDRSYAIQEVYSNEAYKIVNKDGVRVGPINRKFLKRYYT